MARRYARRYTTSPSRGGPTFRVRGEGGAPFESFAKVADVSLATVRMFGREQARVFRAAAAYRTPAGLPVLRAGRTAGEDAYR